MRVQRLVDAPEGEAHLRERLVAHPLLGDRAHLRHQRPALLGQRDHAERDALLARLVERRAHVLPRLAAELQVREVDEGVLGDLHPLPTQRARRVRGLLRRREQARHPAAALAQGRERPHGLAPIRLRSDRVAEADRDAGVPLVGDERLPVGRAEPGVLRPGRHPRQRAAAALLQHLHGRRLVDRGGRGAPPHPTARRHAEGPATDDEDHEDRRPQQLVGGEARQPVVDVEVAAEDRDEDAEHRDDEPEEHVEARDDDGEPPGQPLAPAEPRIRSRTKTNVIARSTRSWVSPRSGPSGPSSGTK